MANKLLGIFLFLILSACSTPSNALTTDEWTVRQGSGEAEKLYTENPPPGDTNEMEAQVKAELPPTERKPPQLHQPRDAHSSLNRGTH